MFENEVRAGIAALDEDGPARWRDALDTVILDMRNADNCVLGQVFEGYWSPEAESFRVNHHAVKCGFFLPDYEVGRYGELTDAWRRELARVPQEA